MSEYVTQTECETRRQRLIDDNQKQTDRIANIEGCLQAQTVELKHLVAQNKWFTGLISAIVSGVGIWLATGMN